MGLLKTNGAAKYRTVALIRFGRGAGQQTMKQQNYWLKVNENCVTENRFGILVVDGFALVFALAPISPMFCH